MDAYQYPSPTGYHCRIGKPLGLPPDEVDDWLVSVGWPLRASYQSRAPDRAATVVPKEWGQKLRALYMNRRDEAAKINGPATDWARIEWGENDEHIPLAIQVPLSEVLYDIQKRHGVLKASRRFYSLDSQPDKTDAAATPPHPPSMPLVNSPKPDRARNGLAPYGTPTSLAGKNRPKYTGPGIVLRKLKLELIETPKAWPGKTPKELGIDAINIPLWMNGDDDVPALHEILTRIHNIYNKTVYGVAFLYGWIEESGRDKKTGEFVDKGRKKIVIISEDDLICFWISISMLPPLEPIELFFELAPCGPPAAPPPPQTPLPPPPPPPLAPSSSSSSKTNKRPHPDPDGGENDLRKRHARKMVS